MSLGVFFLAQRHASLRASAAGLTSIPEIETQPIQEHGETNMKGVSGPTNVVRLGRLRNREDGNRNRIYCTTIVLEIEINGKCAAAEVT